MRNDIDSGLKTRLESPEVQSLIRRLARAVLRDIEKSHFRPEFSCGADRESLFEDIQSELILFILEKEAKFAEYLNQQAHQAAGYIKTAFLNHLRDKFRSRHDFGRLYRQAVKVLKDSGDLGTVSYRNETWFGTPGADRKIHDLADEDLAAVSYPETMEFHGDVEKLGQKRFLIPLAVYFRNRIAEMWGDDRVLIPVRDFTVWIGRFAPFSGPASVESIDKAPGVHPESEDSRIDSGLIRRWAETAAGRFNEKERRLFLMRHGDELDFAEIARRMGYKSPSGPTYPLDNAYHTLRLFLVDLPGLAPDDLNRDAFSLFFEFFIKFLKKSDSNP